MLSRSLIYAEATQNEMRKIAVHRTKLKAKEKSLSVVAVTYFPTNLVYPFTLRVTGIKIAMKQIISSLFFDILSYAIGNIIFYIFKFNKSNCKGIQT